jgi:hypothetical protein
MLLLTTKLLNQGFMVVKLNPSLRKFYGRHHETLTSPIETLGSVASLLAATLYQGNPDRNHTVFHYLTK